MAFSSLKRSASSNYEAEEENKFFEIWNLITFFKTFDRVHKLCSLKLPKRRRADKLFCDNEIQLLVTRILDLGEGEEDLGKDTRDVL
jgi:hypothetical protein